MKFLHTSDWHIGKSLKGRSRFDEQAAVLKQVIDVARAEQVDAVLIAGDLYETSSPSARSQRLVNRALLALARDGVEVLAVAGNHDHPDLFDAYREVLKVVGIHVLGRPRAADTGGVHEFAARSTGEPVRVAMLPFVARRYAVKALDIVTKTPAQAVGDYEYAMRSLIDSLTADFTPDAVNIVLAHATCTGGLMGGGEREAQSIFEYHVPASAFPVSAHYVALGHLHRRQKLPAPAPVHYSGSPFAVDFGEQENVQSVCVVEVSPGTPARVRDVPITAGRRLRTLTGTVADLLDRADAVGDDYLRLIVTEPARAGLRDELLARLPNTLEVRIHPDHVARRASVPTDHASRTPAELFAAYTDEAGFVDARVQRLFAELADDLTQA